MSCWVESVNNCPSGLSHAISRVVIARERSNLNRSKASDCRVGLRPPRNDTQYLSCDRPLVVHADSFDGALINTDPTVGAKALVNNGLLFTLDGLGGANIDAGLAGCADFGINFRCHF